MTTHQYLILDVDDNRANTTARTFADAGMAAVVFDPERPPRHGQWDAILLGAPAPDDITEVHGRWLMSLQERPQAIYTYGDERAAQLYCRGLRLSVSRHLGSHVTPALIRTCGLAGGADAGPCWPTGRSKPMQRIHRLIHQVAGFDSSVLITGESGTGKELVARAIHDRSPRADKPFVPINCGAIPGELLESELFGHEKGAFTGAISTRQGRFEIAEGGTLFLDEIGDMTLAMQVKLLRVLQERSYERVGSSVQRRCDLRIIAATHRDLDAGVAAGHFREDLFYRLNVFPIDVPPLRTRLDDLELLIDELSERIVSIGLTRPTFSETALVALRQYQWPGNVRELGNLVERLTILSAGELIEFEDLPPRYRRLQPSGEPEERLEPEQIPSEGLNLKAYLGEVEARLIREALSRAGGTVSEAARLLGLRRTTLIEKLRRQEPASVQ